MKVYINDNLFIIIIIIIYILPKFESGKIYWLSVKIDWFDSEIYFFTDESVKKQITDSISENLTNSDLESNIFTGWSILNSFEILFVHGETQV